MATEDQCLKALEMHGAELSTHTNVVGVGARENEPCDGWTLVVYLSAPVESIPRQLLVPVAENQVIVVPVAKEVIGEVRPEY